MSYELSVEPLQTTALPGLLYTITSGNKAHAGLMEITSFSTPYAQVQTHLRRVSCRTIAKRTERSCRRLRLSAMVKRQPIRMTDRNTNTSDTCNCGCGKSSLAFVLKRLLKPCQALGVRPALEHIEHLSIADKIEGRSI